MKSQEYRTDINLLYKLNIQFGRIFLSTTKKISYLLSYEITVE